MAVAGRKPVSIQRGDEDMDLQRAATPVAFIYVTDRDRALRFYQETLGLALEPGGSDEYGDYIELGGARLRVTVIPDHQPSPHPVLGWTVDDIGAVAGELAAKGVAFTVYEGMGQDARGIWTSPDGQTRIAFFPDPDGNVLTLSQG
jgi:catechol 2,3-dioxygenase-like lactoylglutathione lyase family enzyme